MCIPMYVQNPEVCASVYMFTAWTVQLSILQCINIPKCVWELAALFILSAVF